MSKTSGYHHGNLRDALILAAVELIEESGSPDFAISEAAKRAGVSPAAPYRHFKDRVALLEAVADLYFIGLAAATRAVSDAQPTGSRESIVALGHTYLDYVSQRPAFYNLIWNEKYEDGLASREEGEGTGFYVFVDAVADWCRLSAPADCDPLEMAVKLWAMAHGLSVLAINGKIDRFMADVDAASLLSSSVKTFLDGVERDS